MSARHKSPYQHVDPFTYRVGQIDDPDNLENHDLYHAMLWTVHLDAGDDLDHCIANLAEHGDDLDDLVTGFAAGDSFIEWVEPRRGGAPAALHVTFRARGMSTAKMAAERIAHLVLGPSAGRTTAALSTGGDWSVQTPIFEEAF